MLFVLLAAFGLMKAGKLLMIGAGAPPATPTRLLKKQGYSRNVHFAPNRHKHFWIHWLRARLGDTVCHQDWSGVEA
jgi:hypothetical protein